MLYADFPTLFPWPTLLDPLRHPKRWIKKILADHQKEWNNIPIVEFVVKNPKLMPGIGIFSTLKFRVFTFMEINCALYYIFLYIF